MTTSDAISLTPDPNTGDARWSAWRGEQTHHGCAFDDANVVTFCDVASQQVLEHDATTSEETDVFVAGLDHRVRKTRSRKLGEAELLRTGIEQSLVQVSCVCLDQLDERREQHMAVAGL
jgi:hypothetical protein